MCSKEVKIPSSPANFPIYTHTLFKHTRVHTNIQWNQISDFSSCLPRFTLEQIFTAELQSFPRGGPKWKRVHAESTSDAQGPQERYSLIKTFMAFESKHNPRGFHVWGKMLFRTRFLLKILWLFVVNKSVSSEAPVIRIVKHSQETNERTIRHRRQRQGQRCGSFLFHADRNFTEFTNVAALGLSNLNHPHLLPHPENVSLLNAFFCILPLHQPTPCSWSQNELDVCKKKKSKRGGGGGEEHPRLCVLAVSVPLGLCLPCFLRACEPTKHAKKVF